MSSIKTNTNLHLSFQYAFVNLKVSGVQSSSDYFPFGSPLPNRGFDGGTYRFGFNGQEQDDEIYGVGNAYTATFWEYDPRLGRRWNIDPEYMKFPHQSSYSCFNNNPILYNDPTGQTGIVTIEGNTITITSTLVFYGSKATPEVGLKCASEIQVQYNNANGKVMYNGKEYNVEYKIYYQVKTESEAYEMAASNESAQYNFIRVEDTKESANPISENRSEMNIGENSAYFVTTDGLGESTTAPHEYGHGMGLLHPQSEGILTLLRMGVPSIMAPRGSEVDAPYRRNPKAKSPNDNGYTIDPAKRRANQTDVKKMFKNLNFNSKTGQWQIGKATNLLYRTKSDKTTPAK